MGDEKVRIVRSGFWDGNTYKNGQSEMIRASLRTSYDAFINKVDAVHPGDRRRFCDYILHFMAPNEDGAMEKCRITCEDDLHYLSREFTIPTIYVTLEPKDHGIIAGTSLNGSNNKGSSFHYVDGRSAMGMMAPTVDNDAPNDARVDNDVLGDTAPTYSPNLEHQSCDVGDDIEAFDIPPKVKHCVPNDDLEQQLNGVDHDTEDDEEREQEEEEHDPDFQIDDPLADLLYESYGWKQDAYFVSEDAECDNDDDGLDMEQVKGNTDEIILRSRRSVPRRRESDIFHVKEANVPFFSSGHGWTVPDDDDCELFKGAVVGSKEELEIKVGFYHLEKKVEYRTPRSSKTRLEVVCRYKRKGCNFLLRGRKIEEGSWRISKFVAPHTCKPDLNLNGPRQLPSKVIAALFAPKLMLDGRVLRPKEMIFDLEKGHGINIKYDKALKAYYKAYNFAYGEHSKSWELMPGYFHMLRKENPGTYTHFETGDDHMFKYAFFALHASIKGFNECCRPVIVVDGTFLKGMSKGVLFVAVTKDANEKVFPLAFGLADKEKDESWVWFMQQLRNAFGCPDNLVVIVSDRRHNIKSAVESVFGDKAVYQGICTFHLRQNIKHYKHQVVSLYQKAAYTYSPEIFKRCMSSIGKVNAKAHDDLLEAGPERWARTQCPARKYSFMTSNSAKSINGRLVWASKLPVCAMFEAIRTLLQGWFSKRRIKTKNIVTEVPKKCYKRLEECRALAEKMEIEQLSDSVYHVKDGVRNFVVNLEDRTCTCHVFQLDLLPCSHAIKAISMANHSIYNYVHAYYKTDTLRRLWWPMIMPVAHPKEWDLPDGISLLVVKPPTITRQPNQPKVKCNPPTGLPSSKKRSGSCSRCGASGHNCTTCDAEISLCDSSSSAPNTQTTSDRAKRKCGECRQEGHTRKRCPGLELTS